MRVGWLGAGPRASAGGAGMKEKAWGGCGELGADHCPEKGESSAIVDRGTRATKVLKNPRDLSLCEAE